MGRHFTDRDREPLKGTIRLQNGNVIDVNGAVLSEEGRAKLCDPATRSKQCRIFYYKMPNGQFLMRQKIPKSNPPSFQYSVCTVSKKKAKIEKYVPREPQSLNNISLSFVTDLSIL